MEEQKKPKIVLKAYEEEFNTLRDKGEVVLGGREKIIIFEGGEQIELCPDDIVVIHCDSGICDYVCKILYTCRLRKEIKVKKLFT